MPCAPSMVRACLAVFQAHASTTAAGSSEHAELGGRPASPSLQELAAGMTPSQTGRAVPRLHRCMGSPMRQPDFGPAAGQEAGSACTDGSSAQTDAVNAGGTPPDACCASLTGQVSFCCRCRHQW